MKALFEAALNYVFENESTLYTDNPHDSGGPTKFGVTLWTYSAFLGRSVLPQEIEELTLDKVKPFYWARYWSPLNCNQIMQAPIAVCLFDSAVLYGVGTAGIFAQKALVQCGASLKFDGVIGDKSIAAFNSTKVDDFLKSFHGLILQRIDAVIKLDPKNEVFRNGWTNRANRLLTLGTYTFLIEGDTTK